MEGFIQLHRKMLEWEWYDDINTKVLFIHLLLKANWKGKEWRGEFIERGSFITSYQKLSDETGLSLQQIRTSINKLKSTGEITYLGQASNSLIKLNKYDEYQTSNTLDNTLATNEQQTSNTRVTTTNKDNNINKDNKDNNIVSKETKELAPIKKNPEIDNLIQELKTQADILGIAYDKKNERNFARHILTAKEFGNFCERIGQERIEFAKNIMLASEKIRFWKGVCAGPILIYQNYAEVYNLTKTKSEASKIVKIETLDW